MFRRVLVLCLIAALLGCGKEAPHITAEAKTPQSKTPTDPVQALYEQMRSGSYQIGAAIDSIEEARTGLKDVASRETGVTHQALLTVVGQLDDGGKVLSDYGTEPPKIEEFSKDFAAEDESRLKAIDAGNEALDDLRDAQDILGDLLDSHPPEPENTQLTKADDALDSSIQSLEDAIKAMGGKVNAADAP